MTIVLASGSPTRAALLRNAGIAFATATPDLDERRVETELAEQGAGASEIAQGLACAKALAVSAADPQALVVGADQTLALGSERLHKPGSREQASRQIKALAGKVHSLHSAVACARGRDVLFARCEEARLWIRALRDDEIAAYLDRSGEAALGSVGAYRLEGLGIRLFERIEGDFFTILGLPLLPLLAYLRSVGEIDL